MGMLVEMEGVRVVFLVLPNLLDLIRPAVNDSVGAITRMIAGADHEAHGPTRFVPAGIR